jgi:class 3 adenylate cyclase
MTDPAFLTFDELVDRSLDDPAAEAELERRYRQTAAILVVDFTGMVHRTNHHGIVYALSLARRAEHIMRPAVTAHAGEVVKRVADTWFAVFPDPARALGALLEGRRALAAFNATRTGTVSDGSRNEPIQACAGLGFGASLVLPGQDLYGEEVNRAFVLGEDTARAEEVLVTDAFLSALGTPPPGVGVHRAAGDRIAEVGFPFHVVADYR